MHRIPLVCSVHNTQGGQKIVFDIVIYILVITIKRKYTMIFYM